MRKLLGLFFAVLAGFSVIACEEATTTAAATATTTLTTAVTTVNPDPAVSDRVATPSGLSLEGSLLSWTAVAGVTTYAVYADGILLSTVSATTYDVGVPAARTIYTVVAQGSAGMLNSLSSLGVAFVPDAAAEIAMIEGALENVGLLEMVPGLASELVRRGMPASEFAAVVETAQPILNSFIEYGPTLDIDQISVCLATVEHREALIGAIIHILPTDILGPQIESIDMIIEMYTLYRDEATTYYEQQMYDEAIAIMEEQRASFLEMEALLLADEDMLIAALTSVVNYMISVYDALNVTALDHFFALIESGAVEPAEIIIVKNEIVNVLLETMPSVDDLALYYRLSLLFVGTAIEADYPEVTFELLANDFATQTLYELELSLRFLLEADALFNEVMDFASSGNGDDPLLPARLIQALAIDYRDFKSTNAVLLAEADAALDDETEYLLFQQAIAISNALYLQSGMTEDQVEAINAFYDAITPALYAKLNTTENLFLDRVMNYLADVDENVLYLAIVARGISYDGETWHNDATFETYANVTEYDYALRAEFFAAIDATIGSLTTAEVADLIEVLTVVLPMEMWNASPSGAIPDVDAFLVIFQDAFDENGETAVALLQRIATYVVDNDVYGGMADLFESINNYWIDQYGEDYCSIDDMDRSYGRYRYFLYFAGHYDALMTEANEADLYTVIGAYYDLKRGQEDLLPVNEAGYWDGRQEITETIVADIIAAARACRGIDIDNLTPADEEALYAFGGAISGILFLHDELI